MNKEIGRQIINATASLGELSPTAIAAGVWVCHNHAGWPFAIGESREDDVVYFRSAQAAEAWVARWVARDNVPSA